jgi:hypothetical protein
MLKSATKRVKQAPNLAESNPENHSVTATTGEASMRGLIELQQLLMKATVQQLHLLPKANAMIDAAKCPQNRDCRTATQFNLILSIKENLEVQENIAHKGSIRVAGGKDLQAVVDQTLHTMATFEAKANDKTRVNHDLNLEALEDSLVGFCDQIMLETQPVIDKWNQAVMKGISANLGNLAKSPVNLAREINESSERIRAINRPLFAEGALGKRQNLDDSDVVNLYEDTPLTHQILKDLLNMNRAFQAELTDGIQFGNTERFLRDRLNRKSLKRDKIQYEERKDRKIKFDVHEKLVDFMPLENHPGLLDNRDTILTNLFAKSAPVNQREAKSRPQAIEADYFEDIDLL